MQKGVGRMELTQAERIESVKRRADEAAGLFSQDRDEAANHMQECAIELLVDYVAIKTDAERAKREHPSRRTCRHGEAQ